VQQHNAATLMMGICAGCLTLTLVVSSAVILRAQQVTPAEATRPLVLTGAIPLPSVQGRIDHLSTDQKGRLFVSDLGNNTDEVVDLSAGTRVHSIGGVPSPQGVVYAQELNQLFVGSDEGELYIHNGSSLDLITTSISGMMSITFGTTRPGSS
jgi:hypothetical protein